MGTTLYGEITIQDPTMSLTIFLKKKHQINVVALKTDGQDQLYIYYIN